MKFCDSCSNTMTLSLDTSLTPPEVKERCLACGAQRQVAHGCQTIFETAGTSFSSGAHGQYVNADIFVDPTIAKLNVVCPQCETLREVKYVKFGPGLDYVYACVTCKTFWIRQRGGKAEILGKSKLSMV